MPNDVLTRAIDTVASRRDLTEAQAAAVLAEIMAGEVAEVQIAGFLVALRTKGETEEELAGLARTMRGFAARVETTAPGELLDTAGTGGGRPTFNVSTTAAFVAAAAGCRVAKHGNRSATSLSGSADVLEALGARIDLDPVAVGRCVDDVGFGFMFAPNHHAATRFVVPVRKELAVRTIFNFLGPLTNPAGATRQLVGVSDPGMLDRMARALVRLGVRRALVVSGEDGLDEMSTSAATRVVEVADGQVDGYAVTPEEAGLERARPEDVPAGTPGANAAVTRRVFAGESGPERDLVALNAGAAIYAAGRAETIAAGVAEAERVLDAGAALAVLERFVARTTELAGTPA
jgi:anthranilate phosphoribosyltransferase